jgi:hypothetical protein
MYTTPSRGRLLETFLFAVASVLLFNLGLGELLFLIPLQIVVVRRGQRGLFWSVAFALALFAGYFSFRFFFVSGRDPAAGMRSLIEITPAVLLMLGLAVANLERARRQRTLARLLAATALAGLLAIPIMLLLPLLPDFSTAMSGIFADLADLLQKLTAPASPAAGSPFAQLLQPASLMQIVKETLLPTFLLYYFLILAFAWWIGSLIGLRTLRLSAERATVPRLSGFRLESFYLWPLIASGALVLLDLVADIPIARYVGWNVGLVVLLLFGLQGMAIVRFIFEKYRLPRGLWVLFVIMIVILLGSPQIGFVTMIVIPAFGVSENWIRYRIPADSPADE